MEILVYNELDYEAVKPQYERTISMLQSGDFRAADVKKMRGTPFYRAKLNDADRLLFRFGRYEEKTYLLVLEVIYQHAYDKSRFLGGAAVDDAKLEPISAPENANGETLQLPYVNPTGAHIHFLGKILSFDDDQTSVLGLAPPVIIIGSAGSGKTVLTLEKMKQLKGELLYVTHSPYLTECSRALYYSDGYDNENQDVEFLSFTELLATSGIPEGKPLDFRAFSDWFNRHRPNTPIKDGHMLHEEFNGVLTGCPVEAPYLSRDDYLGLGVRRSIFTGDERCNVYDLFEKYLKFLEGNAYYNVNVTTFNRLTACEKRYDFAVVDEVQDITNVQLMFILRHLRRADNFLLSGDSNQIVHPNFFSWSNLKSMFYEQQTAAGKRRKIMRILARNYRNSLAVTDLANKILLVKNSRFGSVDRESNYLVNCVSNAIGEVQLLKGTPKMCRDFDSKTSRSTHYAVLVLREEDKKEAARRFNTPLIFSIREAKGLEYENIILFDMVSGAGREFNEIIRGVTAADLEQDNLEYARARDKSDKALEVFKFFINSLYVAVTRSIKNAYFLESRPNHPLFQLLQLADTGAAVRLEQNVSTDKEWQSEASRLEQQGKNEQAEAIRQRVLHQKPVPWRVVTEEELPKLEEEALNPERFNKKAKQLLFDYAMVYQCRDFMPRLAELNFRPAEAPEEHVDNVERRHTQIYREPKLRQLNQQLKTYGVDFRDPLNRTPLMIATSLGLYELAGQLLADGAQPWALDNQGRTPFMIGVMTIATQPRMAASRMAGMVRCVPPQPLILRIGDKLLKIDPHHGLFPIVYAFFSQTNKLFRGKAHCDQGLSSKDIVQFLEIFPPRLVPDYRKRRGYVSSLLARHEYARPEERRLFLRIHRGRYLLNPELQIQLGEKWMRVNDFCHLPDLVASIDDALQRLASEVLLKCLDAMQNGRIDTHPEHSHRGITASPLHVQYMHERSAEQAELLRQQHEEWLRAFHARAPDWSEWDDLID